MPTFTPPSSTSSATPQAATPQRMVTDAPTRMFHWLFALSFVGAYLSAEGERWRLLHVTLGYTLAGLLVFRLLYGLFGPKQVRLGALGRKLAASGPWLRTLAAPGTVNWRAGQNLLMTLATAALLLMVLPLTLSGYATYNDWGGEWLETLHEFCGEAFLVVVLAHLALIAGLSLLRRRNQALPMLGGRIDGPGPDLVKRQRGWLAALLLLAVLSYAAWEWRQSLDGLIPPGALSRSSAAEDDDD